MTATEELRRMLDERGVEYETGDLLGTPIVYWGQQEADGRWPYRFWDLGGGWISFTADPKRAPFTPEQAIEATMGRGECEVVSVFRHDYEGGYAGTEYEHVLSCGHKTWWGSDDSPDYCPWCGRKVMV